MINLKTLVQIVTLVLALAIGPIENRALWFGDSPDQLYGETILFEDAGEEWSLAKNIGGAEIEVISPRVGRMFSRHLENPAASGWVAENTVYPRSIAVLVRHGAESKGEDRTFRVSGKLPMKVADLQIVTVGESQRAFLSFCLLLGLGILLTFGISGYYWQFSPPEWPTTQRDERS